MNRKQVGYLQVWTKLNDAVRRHSWAALQSFSWVFRDPFLWSCIWVYEPSFSLFISIFTHVFFHWGSHSLTMLAILSCILSACFLLPLNSIQNSLATVAIGIYSIKSAGTLFKNSCRVVSKVPIIQTFYSQAGFSIPRAMWTWGTYLKSILTIKVSTDVGCLKMMYFWKVLQDCSQIKKHTWVLISL